MQLGRGSYGGAMARLEIVFSRNSGPSGAASGRRRTPLGRLGTMVAAAVSALVAIAVAVLALVLGYLIAGLIVAAVLLTILVALVAGAFRSLRR